MRNRNFEDILFIVGLYGRLQIELVDIGIILSDGTPKKKRDIRHKNAAYTDVIYIYNFLCEKVKGLKKDEINTIALQTNSIVEELVNRNRDVNNLLLSLDLFSLYIDRYGTPAQKTLYYNKAIRSVDAFVSHAHSIESEDERAKMLETVKNTYRVSDNMWRLYHGESQMSDEERDKKFSFYTPVCV